MGGKVLNIGGPRGAKFSGAHDVVTMGGWNIGGGQRVCSPPSPLKLLGAWPPLSTPLSIIGV